MLFNWETVYYIIWAAVIGIAFAVVYTNLQRDAICRFITALINKEADDAESAVTLQQLNIKGLSGYIVKSAVKNQNGLKKAVSSVAVNGNAPKDEAEALIHGNKASFKYCLKEEVNKDELLKKYSFKKLGFWQIILILAAIIVTAVIATKAVDIFDSFASANYEEETEQKENEEASLKDGVKDEASLSDENAKPTDEALPQIPANPAEPSKPSDDTDTDEGGDKEMSRPSIPMLPTAS